MGYAVLCPGQGAQHGAMFDLLAGQTQADRVFQEAEAVLEIDLYKQLSHISPTRLFQNAFAQPLLCAAALAAWRSLGSTLPAPLLFAGYSIGELAAYGCAAALSVGETLRLAQRRAALMDAAATSPSGLLAVRGLNQAAIDAICNQYGIEVAIINGADHFILGGTEPGLTEAQQAALGKGARTAQRLPVTVAAHTSLLRAAGPAFAEELRAAKFSPPAIPVLAGINGEPVREPETAIIALSSQLYSTVRWSDCMQSAIEMGARTFLELGPGRNLTRILLEAHPEVMARSITEFRSLKAAAAWVNKHSGR
jgi:[acyl-carrier-protein] S-malonyltransferase